MDLQERLTEKINYLNEIYDKFYELNQRNKGEYNWRLRGLEEQLLALEQLRDDEKLNKDWDIAYKEDLRDSQR